MAYATKPAAEMDSKIRIAAAQPAPAIALRELTIKFGRDDGTLAVDNVSLEVFAGQFVSFVGPSGCGKTTILNLLAGLMPAAGEGNAFILGRPPVSGNRDVAYMLARDSLLPWRTALGNAAYGMEVRGVDRLEREERARELLQIVGLGSFVGHYPKSLSHGMRQRCALARTFALDSPVLLMDEPFGALDVQTKLQLEEVLLSLWSERRRTVLFVTHDLSEAITMSDRVIAMSPRPGRIVADMTIDLPRPRKVRALQREPKFHEIYSRLWTLLEQGAQI